MTPPRKVGFVRDDYASAVGADAAERQAKEALVRLDCCGELKEDGHHPMCRRYRDDAVYEIHPGQETLA